MQFINRDFVLDGDRFSVLVWFEAEIDEGAEWMTQLSLSRSQPVCGTFDWYGRRAFMFDSSDELVRFDVRTAYNAGMRGLCQSDDFDEAKWKLTTSDDALRAASVKHGLEEAEARLVVQLKCGIEEVGRNGSFALGPEYSPTCAELASFRAALASWAEALHAQRPIRFIAIRTSNRPRDVSSPGCDVLPDVLRSFEAFADDAEQHPDVLKGHPISEKNPAYRLAQMLGQATHSPIVPGELVEFLHDMVVNRQVVVSNEVHERATRLVRRLVRLVPEGVTVEDSAHKILEALRPRPSP